VITEGLITTGEPQPSPFERELEALINRHSQENGSNTPDFILAAYLVSCLDAWNRSVQRRESWYGRKASYLAPAATGPDAPPGPPQGPLGG